MSGPQEMGPQETQDTAARETGAEAAAAAALEAAAVARSNTALLVRRPILAFVLNALIVLAGLGAFMGAEVRELPDVDRPVVTVSTDFDGASPETIDREVTAVIEGAAGRVSGVKAISSTSRYGSSRVTVEFRDDVDLDVAATDLRDAVARVTGSLPDDADDPRVVKADADSSPVMRLAVTSATRSPQDLTRIVTDEVEDRILSAPGVADLQVYGDRTEVFRVDVDMAQLASRGLTLADLRETLAVAAFDSPAGSLSAARNSLQVRATAPLTTGADFEALEIAPDVRLGEVARVTLGPDPGDTILRANGETGIGLGVLRQAQSNTLDISRAVRAAVADIQTNLPPDVRIFVSSDSANFINGAIHEVELALGLSVLIVTAVIWLFLRDLRATLIPVIAIPVSLIGTVAAIWIVGFSINILTLLALVLATGMVVDDAIVVLENIVRRRAAGLGPRAAAVMGTQQVFFAVIATTTTLAAVFVPLSFLPGQTGGLFREFGFTLAISVLLSSVTALTLCPVLASRLLSAPAEAQDGGLLGRIGGAFAGLYARTLGWCLSAPLVAVAVSALFAATALFVYPSIRQELTPEEDRALVILSVRTPQGVALDYTDVKMREIEARLDPLVQSGEIVSSFVNVGQGGNDNRGFVVLALADWGERSRSQAEITADVQARIAPIVGARIFAIAPNSLGIRGADGELSFALAGSNYDRLAALAAEITPALEAIPGVARVELDYETTQPQLFLQVDRRRAADIGVNIDGLGEALQAVLDGRTVATVFLEDDSFDVKMVSTGDPVNDPGDLERIFVRAQDGQMVPISTFVRLEEKAVAPELSREQQLRAVPVEVELEPGLGIGDAWAAAQRAANEVLPADVRLIPMGEAATLGEQATGLAITFGMAVLIVLLVLAAQFESFVSAAIVMATVPLGLACAIFALLVTGGSMNVYSQIGLVLLVGIMAKNGILIVEFANQLRDEGRPVRAAIEEACIVRLRPVMMTMIATVLGGLPLIFAHGAGAEAREVLGWIIVGGLGIATIATLYVTPVAYLLLAGLSKPKAAEEARLMGELRAAPARAPHLPAE
ncbi:efflux RND transporter permease subunit [Frigidibacter oleivorans]|uniref:efflux RND transporter permease subunit n=1 Tax=Frigidibacter oleivorans TaxID=2487129 RepID=UPI001F2E3FCD|nr:efflux RND transporter permease subunit [Frigidibacter oleivorans]